MQEENNKHIKDMRGQTERERVWDTHTHTQSETWRAGESKGKQAQRHAMPGLTYIDTKGRTTETRVREEEVNS